MFGYTGKHLKQIERLKKRVTKLEQRPDEQIIMFWNLQLQFMELHEQVIGRMFLNSRVNGISKQNKHTDKMIKLANKAIYDGLKEKDRLCLCTHLALQLSGLA